MFDFIQIETNLRKLIYLGFEKFPVHVLEISSLVTDSQMRSVTPFISTNKILHACLNFSLIKSEIHIYWRDPNKNLNSCSALLDRICQIYQVVQTFFFFGDMINGRKYRDVSFSGLNCIFFVKKNLILCLTFLLYHWNVRI